MTHTQVSMVFVLTIAGCSTTFSDVYQKNQENINAALIASEAETRREVVDRKERYLRELQQLADAERDSRNKKRASDEEQKRLIAALVSREEAQRRAELAKAAQRKADEAKEQQRREVLVDKEVSMVREGTLARPVSMLAAARLYNAGNPSVIARPLLEGDGKNYVFQATAVRANREGTRLLLDMDPLNSRALAGAWLLGGVGAYAAASVNTKFYGVLSAESRRWMTANGVGLNQEVYGVGRYLGNRDGVPELEILWIGLQKEPAR